MAQNWKQRELCHGGGILQYLEANCYLDTTQITNDDINKGKDLKIPIIMKRSSILKGNREPDFNLYYTEKPPEFLCENCGTILASKQALKHHMVTKHSEKVTTYQCSKCNTMCNRLDNMRCHIRKHPGPTTTPKIVSCEIEQMSPEPRRPRRQPRQPRPLITRPYLSKPHTPDDYIYQQTLRPNQRPIPWRLIPIDIPESTKKNIPYNPKDPRLSQD